MLVLSYQLNFASLNKTFKRLTILIISLQTNFFTFKNVFIKWYGKIIFKKGIKIAIKVYQQLQNDLDIFITID